VESEIQYIATGRINSLKLRESFKDDRLSTG